MNLRNALSCIERHFKVNASNKSLDDRLNNIWRIAIEHTPPLPETVYEAFDMIYCEEENKWFDPSKGGIRFSLNGTEIVVIKGDITNCKVELIVNAANEKGLGCTLRSRS